MLRLTGYLAKDCTVLTQDGYALNLVEGWNPLIDYDCTEPVMFIYGTLSNAICFITDTPEPASPKDYSKHNASQMEKLYKDSPKSQSLVLVLLGLCHKVFLINRRITLASL